MDEKQKREYQTVVLAALLHDIGKFYQRGLDEKARKSRNHASLGLECFQNLFAEKIRILLGEEEKEKIASAINTHHDHADIITLADALSAGMDRISLDDEEKTGDPDKERLLSVFEQISLGNNTKNTNDFAYRLETLSLEKSKLFPNDKLPRQSLKDEYKNLWESFEKEVKSIPTYSISSYLNILYSILQKYTWCIPSATYKDEPDISLFDHAKTTAAITGCLYHCEKMDKSSDNKFLIVGGDISGIQNFIYRITKAQGVKGISKMLRGRSFYLLLLQDVIARHIIEQVSLFSTNILYSGGGRFELLLPNTGESKQILKSVQTDVNKWLFKMYGGELGLVLESVEANQDTLKGYGDLLLKLNDKLTIAKKKKFLSSFTDATFWIEETSDRNVIKVCKACGISTVTNDEPCELCNLHKNIGNKLPNTSYLIFRNKDLENIDGLPVPFGEFGTVYLLENDKLITENLLKSKKILAIEKINKLDKLQTGFRFIGNTAPLANADFSIGNDPTDEDKQVKKGNVLSFEIIADTSIGDKRLGILKMDVDHLGLIFTLGLEEEQHSKRKSISRIAALSRSMDMFFGGYLNKICNEIFEQWRSESKWEHRDKVTQIFYTVYSGGDDLLIIGPWSEMPKLALKIQDEFKAYTCHNPDINISAGIFLCKPKYPISLAAKAAGEQLNTSKDNGRKRITLFGDTVEWIVNGGVCVKELLDFGEDLHSYINSENSRKKLPRGFVHELLRKHKQYKSGQDPNFIPAIIYQLARNVKDDELRNKLKETLITDKNCYFKHIQIPTSYALLKLRKGE
ncbi:MULTISPECIES: type III-A CRISPR-associated protein Cas10/Csm1 [Candidatus Brocadia]|uniref:CRISPR system single-strand-specific deoxyribonuclease Cas10/Csm1 (subtype III-A) n=1 Tax=Candidatus Brocadia sinica JPN1 TaxID=1197129 RepID=A0ABQ0JTJ7_9BACT|nr:MULTISPECIES: type III-A CRISPR-associated protein Cas10/Csm1 [Brocadia]NOG39971.1 type III-A CRISPR-associated protein Cas10/Csm1 [Planctomycetota bacterium]NUQ57676.1 type III-A CRISPR-associated protein Cas10/Csm1 [Candidatus Paceibacter sp.]GIK12859.1 MAG: type III-A CRISPR-associated protein Cas10/Csm1 [Candidatus Brocadia sinica]GAN32046.1 hydrolase of the HD superfamily [Candidatus Brocadia sinica JPN1]GJQ17790.1 MAG: type III-A CRISPR-associated protein Cas10/Csm1 [Candidatus Brocad